MSVVDILLFLLFSNIIFHDQIQMMYLIKNGRESIVNVSILVTFKTSQLVVVLLRFNYGLKSA